MKFEEAFEQMRYGKNIKRKQWSKEVDTLSIINILVWDKNPDRTAIELKDEDLMAEDWEIVE